MVYSLVHIRYRGFTLIETLVALLVVAVAYAGVTTAVSRFVDQRQILIERNTSHRIAWNRLMEQYLLSQGIAVDEQGFAEKRGQTALRGIEWRWEIREEKAAGEGLVRYQVDVVATGNNGNVSDGSLAAFFIR